MLKVKMICVGKMKERFYVDAYNEYAKRMSAFCSLELTELQEVRLPDSPGQNEITAALSKEAVNIKKELLKDAFTVAMCVEGRLMDSEGLSTVIRDVEGSGHPRMNFIIGGSYGLAEEVKQSADLKLSLSKMTFPHHLARVMLAEQIYRGFKINEGSQYHK